MILSLRIHRLQRLDIRLLHSSNHRALSGTLPTARSRPPHCSPNGIPHPHHYHRQRCTPLMSCPILRSKDRCNSRTTQSNILHHNPTGHLLWPMFRNLRSQSQLHTNRSRINTPDPLRTLIRTTIILIIKKLCTSTSLLS